MVARSKHFIAAALLGLFMIHLLTSCLTGMLLDENRKCQQKKLLSEHTTFSEFRFNQKEFTTCYLPEDHELLWNNKYYDIKENRYLDGVFYVKALNDQKESNTQGFAKKNPHKPFQKRTGVFQAKLLKYLPQHEITFHFKYRGPDQRNYLPVVMSEYASPPVSVTKPPPDLCSV